MSHGRGAVDEAAPTEPSSDERKCGFAATVASDTAVADAPPRRQTEPIVDQDTKIGRYVVIDRLGAGGMGVVYRAFDPELHREIALKLVSTHGGPEDSQGAARLLREAQAMAKVAHPHVVQVYDAGTTSTGEVYIAMEYVEGTTLSAWLRREPRSWRDIARIFVAAGRGLEAAHAKGLVHRDFKPDNVLVAADGRACVVDFGLAHQLEGSVTARHRNSKSRLDEDLTEVGAIMGTPHYMSPEQHRGLDTDARSDQFSFGIALYDALYGERPFAGGTYETLAKNVIEGRLREPPAATNVPAYIRNAIVCALAAEPARRFPTMKPLLDELDRDPDRGRRRALAIAGVLALGATMTTIAVTLARREAPAVCGGQERGVTLAWNALRAPAVQVAFVASNRHYANDTFHRVAESLNAYAGTVILARTDACEATHVRHEQSDALLDLRMRCLDRRTSALAALVELFSRRGDVDVLDNAAQAVAALPPVSACADIDALQAPNTPPGDAATRVHVDELRDALARVEALHHAGKYAEGLERATLVANEANATGYAPLVAEVLYVRGELEDAAGEPVRAEATLRDALTTAAEAHDDALAAQIWPVLIHVIGVRRVKPEEAAWLGAAAQLAVRRAGNRPLPAAALHAALGGAFYTAGKYADSQREHEHALAIREKELGGEHEDVATSLSGLGLVLKARGTFDQARQCLERSIAIREKLLGPDHPALAVSLSHLGVVMRLLGKHADAERYHLRTLSIRERALGPDHPRVADALNNLGVVMRELGRYREAEQYHQRALAIRERVLGSDHPEVAMSLNNLGITARMQGRYDDARLLQTRALAIRERALGVDHPKVALTLDHLGETELAAGHAATALRDHERALAIQDRAQSIDPPERALSLRGIAAAQLALGHALEARQPAEAALRLVEGQVVAPADVAASQFVLARVLWALDADRARAVALAKAAAAGFEQDGEPNERLAVASWLRTHDAGR